MAFRSKTYKGEGYNELLFEDGPGREQLNLHAQRDMNVVVLNDKSTYIHHRHTEVIEKNKTLTVQAQRNKTVHKNEYVSLLGNMGINVEKQESKQVKKDILISSQNGSISFSVGDSLISLDNEGTLFIQSGQVKIDGEKVFFNKNKVANSTTSFTKDNSNLRSKNISTQEKALYSAITNDKAFCPICPYEGRK